MSYETPSRWRYATFATVLVACISFVTAFMIRGGDQGGLFFVFTMPLFLVTTVFAARWQTVVGQIILIAGTLAYSGWVSCRYAVMPPLSADALVAMQIMFVGLYAAPVLGILWWIGHCVDRRLSNPRRSHKTLKSVPLLRVPVESPASQALAAPQHTIGIAWVLVIGVCGENRTALKEKTLQSSTLTRTCLHVLKNVP